MVLIPKTRNFIHRNNGFQCDHCGKKNPKAAQTCRNHCCQCLYSQHVDEIVPGDRLSICQGLMEPIHLEIKAKKGYQIIHQCLRCGKKMTNKTADDDNLETIIAVMQRQNINNTDEVKPSLLKKKHPK